MSGVGVTLDGLDTFAQTAEAASHALADLDAVNAEAGDTVVQAVEAPRVTGRLASTVQAVAGPDGFSVVAGGPDAPYAPYVHARNPFLTRALDQREREVIGLYEAHVTDTVATIQGA